MSTMIDDLETYFKEFIPPRDDLLLRLEREAEAEGIPIIGPVVGELLHLLTRISGPRRILELGAAIGYSALHLARGCGADGRVVTLEHDPEMAARARANLAEAGMGDRVAVLEGDALSLMAGLEGPFQMVFMDIDKRFYRDALDECARLVPSGGLLVADNTGFRDADPFNRAFADSPGWRGVNLLAFLPRHSPERDGLCLAARV